MKYRFFIWKNKARALREEKKESRRHLSRGPPSCLTARTFLMDGRTSWRYRTFWTRNDDDNDDDDHVIQFSLFSTKVSIRVRLKMEMRVVFFFFFWSRQKKNLVWWLECVTSKNSSGFIWLGVKNHWNIFWKKRPRYESQVWKSEGRVGFYLLFFLLKKQRAVSRKKSLTLFVFSRHSHSAFTLRVDGLKRARKRIVWHTVVSSSRAKCLASLYKSWFFFFLSYFRPTLLRFLVGSWVFPCIGGPEKAAS